MGKNMKWQLTHSLTPTKLNRTPITGSCALLILQGMDLYYCGASNQKLKTSSSPRHIQAFHLLPPIINVPNTIENTWHFHNKRYPFLLDYGFYSIHKEILRCFIFTLTGLYDTSKNKPSLLNRIWIRKKNTKKLKSGPQSYFQVKIGAPLGLLVSQAPGHYRAVV